MNTISKCVLDEVHQKALLSMALQEGLIEIDDDKSDRVYSELKNTTVNDDIKHSLLEQITLTPHIICDDQLLSECIRGDLVDKGFFSFVPKYQGKIDNDTNIPFPALMAMLRSRRCDLSEEEVIGIISKVISSLEEEDNFVNRTGKKPPTLWVEQLLRLTNTNGGSYSDEELAEQEKRQSIYKEGEPILNCYRDYVKVVDLSIQENALIKVPAIEYDYNKKDIEEYIKDDYVLFRVVANEIGQLTYMPDLKGTIKLSEDGATKELRFQLSEWIDMISTGKISEVEYIKKEIKFALSKLEAKKKYGNIGKLATYVGLPVSAIGIVTPLMGIPGLIITIAGALTTTRVSFTERKYKWAMFGNK